MMTRAQRDVAAVVLHQIDAAVRIAPTALQARECYRERRRQSPGVSPSRWSAVNLRCLRSASRAEDRRVWIQLTLQARKKICQKTRHVKVILVPGGHEVKTCCFHFVGFLQVFSDLPQCLLLLHKVVLLVVGNVLIHLGPNHAIRDSVALQFTTECLLHLGEPSSCHHHHLVEVSQPHVLQIRLSRDGRCSSARKVPEADQWMIWIRIHGGHSRRLVHPNGSPSFCLRPQLPQPVD
mmetsp:Transcript_133732/g.316935  ORF Transcript_133732/g.316935 Transcript_133732/m.316935 type:complete len:236 (-) Transcript_133732:580-1287(-)